MTTCGRRLERALSLLAEATALLAAIQAEPVSVMAIPIKAKRKSSNRSPASPARLAEMQARMRHAREVRLARINGTMIAAE